MTTCCVVNATRTLIQLDNSKRRPRAISEQSDGKKIHGLSCNIDYPRIHWVYGRVYHAPRSHRAETAHSLGHLWSNNRNQDGGHGTVGPPCWFRTPINLHFNWLHGQTGRSLHTKAGTVMRRPRALTICTEKNPGNFGELTKSWNRFIPVECFREKVKPSEIYIYLYILPFSSLLPEFLKTSSVPFVHNYRCQAIFQT